MEQALLAWLTVTLLVITVHGNICGLNSAADHGTAAASPTADYSAAIAVSRQQGIDFAGLPGFSRSVYRRDHALVAPESRVWAAQRNWQAATTCHFVSKASGAHFNMFMANLSAGGVAGPPRLTVERFVLVLSGSVEVSVGEGTAQTLQSNQYVYFPDRIQQPTSDLSLTSKDGAFLLIYERDLDQAAVVLSSRITGATVLTGTVDDSPLLPVPGEVFKLRKLLPQTAQYDFNVHVMDFEPGEYLNVKEVHYNQHGLLLLEGQGIYRLADQWYPVQAGDAIWMAPYVLQWYAALGTTRTRYIIYKDTTADPLFTP